jgi:D-glycero-D-manno-heptose 1,7-bisphosphate phosphatase
MLEKAIARFHLDPAQCWMIGDRYRDMQAGAKVGVRGVLVGHSETAGFQPHVADLQAATDLILGTA